MTKAVMVRCYLLCLLTLALCCASGLVWADSPKPFTVGVPSLVRRATPVGDKSKRTDEDGAEVGEEESESPTCGDNSDSPRCAKTIAADIQGGVKAPKQLDEKDAHNLEKEALPQPADSENEKLLQASGPSLVRGEGVSPGAKEVAKSVESASTLPLQSKQQDQDLSVTITHPLPPGPTSLTISDPGASCASPSGVVLGSTCPNNRTSPGVGDNGTLHTSQSPETVTVGREGKPQHLSYDRPEPDTAASGHTGTSIRGDPVVSKEGLSRTDGKEGREENGKRVDETESTEASPNTDGSVEVGTHKNVNRDAGDNGVQSNSPTSPAPTENHLTKDKISNDGESTSTTTTTTTTTTTLLPELTNNNKANVDSSSISSSVWVRVPLLIVVTLACILVC
ncbi:uncharacterized protein TM35_000471610 [Trypanosoma theileri]|uniref:Mucin TcMUCII n=1 Tax=Trypanosoma theileri TaxID=67003 RepID=A0A1X0NHV9_9TRYP|nr:uncharacterized protein TM35_000471610 [Trypanosoma theileri]ORC84266.1 hypothetical protein TM35_000471610 [Trypanosoma theileri]